MGCSCSSSGKVPAYKCKALSSNTTHTHTHTHTNTHPTRSLLHRDGIKTSLERAIDPLLSKSDFTTFKGNPSPLELGNGFRICSAVI
jgi:hypothetical protein